MRCGLAMCAVLWTCGLPAAEPAPFAAKEQLLYSLNWPSGLSFGDGSLQAELEKSPAGDRRRFSFSLDAAVPGYRVAEQHSASADSGYCSIELLKRATRGKRKTDEKVTFDQRGGRAERATAGGGRSQIEVPACAKDALAFLYHLRSELAQGRLPSSQPVVFGAAYQVRLDHAGVQKLSLGEERVEADRLTATIKGPGSATKVELYFARDAARTPVLVRVPLSIGVVSLEIVR